MMNILIGVIDREFKLSAYTAVFSGRNALATLRDGVDAGIKYDLRIIVADMPRIFCPELDLPERLSRKNLEAVLAGKLDELMPVAPEELVWGYRIFPEIPGKIRLCALRHEILRDINAVLADRQFEADIIIPAGLIAVEDSRDSGQNPAAAICDCWRGDPDFKCFGRLRNWVPPELRPVRNRVWQRLYYLMLAAAVLSLLLAFWKRYSFYTLENRAVEAAIDSERKFLAATRQRFGIQSEMQKTAQKIQEYGAGLSSLVPIMADLESALPETMWLVSFSSAGNIINIVVRSEQDEPNLHRLLDVSESYSFVNLRKTSGPDSTVSLYIKLRGAEL